MGVGENVRRRRGKIGITVDRLATLSEMAADRLTLIEGGHSPSTAELHDLARALEIDPALLFRGEVETSSLRSAARFRAPEGVHRLDEEDTELLSKASEVGRLVYELQRLLGLDDSPVRSARAVRGVKAQPEPWRQGYELGQRAREKFDNSGKSLRSVQALFEENFIHVARVEFQSPGIEAASLLEPEAAPVILLNWREERIRRPLSRRAVLAHELGHLLHDGGERDLTIVTRDEANTPVESRANGFAPNFLAPGPHVRLADGGPLEQVLAIAREWGLSFEGAVWHAKNLDHISPSDAERILPQGRNIVIDAHFEPDLPRTPPSRYALDVTISPLADGLLTELALQAHGDQLISSGRALEILTLR